MKAGHFLNCRLQRNPYHNGTIREWVQQPGPNHRGYADYFLHKSALFYWLIRKGTRNSPQCWVPLAPLIPHQTGIRTVLKRIKQGLLESLIKGRLIRFIPIFFRTDKWWFSRLFVLTFTATTGTFRLLLTVPIPGLEPPVRSPDLAHRAFRYLVELLLYMSPR